MGDQTSKKLQNIQSPHQLTLEKPEGAAMDPLKL